MRNTCKIFVEKLKGTYYSEKLGVVGKIMLEFILEKQDGKCRLDSSGSVYGPVADSCEHGNEL
jgi:hypothetical protein